MHIEAKDQSFSTGKTQTLTLTLMISVSVVLVLVHSVVGVLRRDAEVGSGILTS